MAIDSKEKRSGAQLLSILVPQPVGDDSTLDQGDRQFAAGVYPGILASTAAEEEAAYVAFRGNLFENMFRRTRGFYGRLD